MKQIHTTIISTIMLFIPWTILPLRTFDWALESPAAEIMISCYAAFMIFSGIFTLLFYAKGRAYRKSSHNHRSDDIHPADRWMQVCAVITGLYMVVGVAVFCMMGITKFL